MSDNESRSRDPLSRWVVGHPLLAGLLLVLFIAVGVWARMGRYE